MIQDREFSCHLWLWCRPDEGHVPKVKKNNLINTSLHLIGFSSIFQNLINEFSIISHSLKNFKPSNSKRIKISFLFLITQPSTRSNLDSTLSNLDPRPSTYPRPSTFLMWSTQKLLSLLLNLNLTLARRLRIWPHLFITCRSTSLKFRGRMVLWYVLFV